jgi:hypothetical protein
MTAEPCYANNAQLPQALSVPSHSRRGEAHSGVDKIGFTVFFFWERFLLKMSQGILMKAIRQPTKLPVSYFCPFGLGVSFLTDWHGGYIYQNVAQYMVSPMATTFSSSSG